MCPAFCSPSATARKGRMLLSLPQVECPFHDATTVLVKFWLFQTKSVWWQSDGAGANLDTVDVAQFAADGNKRRFYAKNDAMIVGAGPVGLGAAFLIRRAGIATRIVDQAVQPAAESKALAVNPELSNFWNPQASRKRCSISVFAWSACASNSMPNEAAQNSSRFSPA